MNSIDTFIPTLLPLLESEEGITTSPVATPDAAALEALRALMGGGAPPAAAFGTSATGGSTPTSQKPSPSLPAVLEQLLKSDGLPPALVPLLTSLRGNLQKGGTAHSDPALVAEIKTLLRNIAPAQPGVSTSAGTGLLSSPLTAPPAPLTPGAVDNTSHSSVAKTSGAPLLDAVVGKEALSSPVGKPPVAPVAESPPTLSARLPDTIAVDVAALAHALMQILDDTPQINAGNVILPTFESLIDEEFSRPVSPDKPVDAQNLGSAILQSLGHQSVPTPVQRNDQAASSTGAAERVTEVSNLITQMADRVLVTDPLHGQTQEVRIKIADTVMEGTEVRVWREDGGALRVEFDTTSAYWSRILNDASPLLSQRLNERLPSGTEAQVTVTVQQQGQQPEDGRSRNRQNPWELAQQGQES
ncbi:MAG: hypothetical protein ACO1TE_07275 [Prosthecobacter sp.]